jgi:hypothetical protein
MRVGLYGEQMVFDEQVEKKQIRQAVGQRRTENSVAAVVQIDRPAGHVRRTRAGRSRVDKARREIVGRRIGLAAESLYTVVNNLSLWILSARW